MSEEISELLHRAEDLPDNQAKVDLLNEAASFVDSRQDIAAGFKVRLALLEATLGGGFPEPMTVAFSWCLAQSDRHPELVPPEQMLWQYRWVLSEMPHFPQISLKQIHDTIADMTRRYREAGHSLRSVHLLKINVAITLGDTEMADAAYEDWSRAERDHFSDSHRTEEAFVLDYLVFRKRYDEAIARSTNVLNGRVDDPHFFGQDSAELLLPLLKTGRVADAARIQRSGYRYLARKNRYLNSLAFHIEFHGRTDNWTAGVKVFEDHIGFALDTKQYSDRFAFLLGSYLFFARLVQSGEKRVKLKLPKEFPIASGSDRKVALSALTAWLRADVGEWAAKFDSRNGNDYHANELFARDEAVSLPTVI